MSSFGLVSKFTVSIDNGTPVQFLLYQWETLAALNITAYESMTNNLQFGIHNLDLMQLKVRFQEAS
jgi:hypothetical protein